MDLQAIRTFVTVAKLQSFTAAAKEHNYAQSTVTMQIQRLEKELGYPLFDRIGKHIYLSEGGRHFLPHAERIAHAMEQAALFGQDYQSVKATIRIGVFESLLFSRLLPLLPAYRSAFPNLEISLKIGQGPELLEALRTDRLDAVYISSAGHLDPQLVCLYQKRERLLFVAHPAHPLAGRQVEAREVFDYPFIVTEPGGYCYGRLREIAAEQQCVPHHNVTLDSVMGVCRLLSDCENVAFLPKYALEQQFQKGELAEIVTQLPPQLYDSRLLCNKDKWISPFLTALVALLQQKYPDTGC